ncbi:hypothetical protein [Dyella sp. 2HG41-7]|uniref:hypothetical protein n=1 Tax=Dyella sp. 2HG41-7 TaxID=2883239 RepID=UPI001F16DE69|nr:hypothetical protein [Dyella sp. 2HG41-7]
MSNLIDRVLTMYRPMYLRGLLMDGQYRLPATPEKKPEKGAKVIEVTPAFDPKRRRTLVTKTPAVGLHARSRNEPSGGISGA